MRLGFSLWVGKIPWRRKWQSTPVLLPGKSHGQRSPVGYSPWVTKSRTRLSDFTSLSQIITRLKKKSVAQTCLSPIWSHHFMGNRLGNSGNSARNSLKLDIVGCSVRTFDWRKPYWWDFFFHNIISRQILQSGSGWFEHPRGEARWTTSINVTTIYSNLETNYFVKKPLEVMNFSK